VRKQLLSVTESQLSEPTFGGSAFNIFESSLWNLHPENFLHLNIYRMVTRLQFCYYNTIDSTMNIFRCWSQLEDNLQSLPQAFRNGSKNDFNKFKTHLWRAETSIWGKVSKQFFGSNLKWQRWHLFLIWKENRKNIQVKSILTRILV